MTGFKKSAVVSFLFMIILASACILQYFNRSPLGIFFVEKKDAMAILRTKGMRNTEEINQACAVWTSKNGVTLLIYGQRKAAIDSSETPNLTSEMIQECRANFLAEVNYKAENRKSENDAVVVRFNLSQVPVKNKADERTLAEMFDSIYFSKFKRNTIIVASVGNYKNMTNIGFNRTIEDETVEGKEEKAENERKRKGEEEPEEKEEETKKTKVNEKKKTEEAKVNEKKNEKTKVNQTKNEKTKNENNLNVEMTEETKEDKEKTEETKDKEQTEENKKIEQDKETKEENKKIEQDKETKEEDNNKKVKTPLNPIDDKKETKQQEVKDKIIPEKTPLAPTV